jgi:porin
MELALAGLWPVFYASRFRPMALALAQAALTLLLPAHGLADGLALPAEVSHPSCPKRRASLHYAYTVNLAANPVGGFLPGQSAYADNHLLTLRLPFASALRGIEDPSLILEGYNRDGRNLSAVAIGNQFTVQQLYGVEALAFYSVRMQGRLLGLGGNFKIGRFAAGDDFAAFPVYGLAMNNAIDGNPQSLLVNTGFTTFPNAVWAATADVAVAEHASLRLGAYQVTEPDVQRYHGFNWAIRPSDGLLLISQLERCDGCIGVGRAGNPPAWSDQSIPSVWREEPSYPLHHQRLALGGYWSLKSSSTFDGTPSPPSTYGAWFHADRTLIRRTLGGPALSLWGSMTVSPQSSVARLPLFWALGLVHYGLDPHRPQDSTMLAIYQGHFSRAYLGSITDQTDLPGQETVIELGYRRRLSAKVFLQPNLQLVIHPSGLSIPTALVMGFQAGLSF